jgi:hypothetical protein
MLHQPSVLLSIGTGVFFSRLFRLASKQPSMCVGFFFIVSSMMAPARIGVCLICRAKLVHKKKDFGRGHVYRIIADTDC